MYDELDVIESKSVGDCTIHIRYDDFNENPRDWDNIGKLLIFGGGNRISINELGIEVDTSDFSSWAEMEAFILKKFPGALLLPVYIMSHGGVAYSTEPFNDPWDSGRVGLIIATKETMLKEYGSGKSRLTKEIINRIESYLKGEISVFSSWANGEVYKYTIYDATGELVESVGGYYDDDDCMEDAIARCERMQ